MSREAQVITTELIDIDPRAADCLSRVDMKKTGSVSAPASDREHIEQNPGLVVRQHDRDQLRTICKRFI